MDYRQICLLGSSAAWEICVELRATNMPHLLLFRYLDLCRDSRLSKTEYVIRESRWALKSIQGHSYVITSNLYQVLFALSAARSARTTFIALSATLPTSLVACGTVSMRICSAKCWSGHRRVWPSYFRGSTAVGQSRVEFSGKKIFCKVK